MKHPDYPHLFSPVRIGDFEVPNRICHVPTDISSANADGSVNERVIRYHEEIAKGGCGFIIVGASTPDRATGRPTVTCLSLDEDPMIPGLAELAEAMHRHGARCAVQIQHPGRQAAWPRNGQLSASDQVVSLPGSAGHEVITPGDIARGKSVRAMNVEEIYELIDKFAEAAWRVKQAGFDAVELHGAHGYLIAQFMSPYVNKRTDRFGGSFLNRMRFVLEALSRIKRKCGKDYPVGVRYSGEEWIEGGRELSESVQVAQLLEQEGIAFVDISAGIFETPATVMDPVYYPQGWNTYSAEEVKRHVSIPVITSHSLRDPGHCEAILARGKADLVGMSRQMIADPHWANKAYARQPHEIRRCISCLVGCWQESLMAKRHMRCTVNPAVGDERFLHIQPATKPLNVAIVGGGPAGMEAARIASMRGHRVTIFEKTGELGGAILYCCGVPAKYRMRWHADWLRQQIRKLAVETRLHCEPGIAELRDYDAVLLATGSKVHRPAVPGTTLPFVVTYEDVLRCGRDNCEFHDPLQAPPAECGDTVLIWGDHFAASDTAEKLARDRKKVYIVTENPEFGAWMEPCHRDVLFKRFSRRNCEGLKDQPYEHEVTMITSTTVLEMRAGGEVILLDDQFRKRRLRVSNVVLAAVVPNESPYDELRKAGLVAMKIGDHKQVRNLLAAVREGANAGLVLDEDAGLNANQALISPVLSAHPSELTAIPAEAEAISVESKV